MTDEFRYDVFLSYSRRDRERVREIAERLRADGLRVWPGVWHEGEDEGERLHGVGGAGGGAATAARREEGLEQSRVLVLCLSAQAYGDEWAQLEAETFRFRDPLHQARRFLLLRLDAAPVKESLAQFPCINWLPEVSEQEYAKLLDTFDQSEEEPESELPQALDYQLEYKAKIHCYAFSSDGEYALTGSVDGTVRLWHIRAGDCYRVLRGHNSVVRSVTWSDDQRFALSGALDGTVRFWDVDGEGCLNVCAKERDTIDAYLGGVFSIAWTKDLSYFVYGDAIIFS